MTRRRPVAQDHTLRAVAAVGLLVAAGCTAPPPGGTPTTTRAAAYRSCPRLLVDSLGPPYALVERTLPNLGDGVHGRIERWSDGSASVTFYAGHDVFDDLEDLDFSERTVVTPVRSYVVHETAVDPILLAVSWEAEQAPASCARMAAVARRLPEAELLRIADGTHFSPLEGA